MQAKVPNTLPKISAPYRIAFIGEAPGKGEEALGQPFVGASGRFFNGLLSQAQLLRDACFVGNVFQYRPEDNNIATIDMDDPRIDEGWKTLTQELNEYRPHLIVPMGNFALHFCRHPGERLKRKRVQGEWKFSYPDSVDNWRGSMFLSQGEPLGDLGIHDVKCIPTYHPAYCLRDYSAKPFLMMDMLKIAKEGLSPELKIKEREFILNPNADHVCDFLQSLLDEPRRISCDIEGGLSGISMISIATAADWSFLIRFFKVDGSSQYSLDEEARITQLLAKALESPAISKIWQNGLYDRFVLQYGFSMPVFGNLDDTMPKWWEKYCELEKGLSIQTSVLTDQPFYKGGRKSDSDEVFGRYCCTDSAVTYEINEKLTPLLAAHSPASSAHYQFNHVLLNLFLYIELRGIRYDSDLASRRLQEVNLHLYKLQHELDIVSGYGVSPLWQPATFELLARTLLCTVRDANTPLKKYVDSFGHILSVCRKSDKTPEDLGYLSTQLGIALNIKSPIFKKYVYERLKCPPQYNKEGTLSTDGLALLKVLREKPSEPIRIATQIALLRTRTVFLSILCDQDGRIRCGYNVVGSNTGRITCYTSPTGSGYNLQTLPDADGSQPPNHPLRNGMRDLATADRDHYFFQCDLKGSDGWTIGAHLARLGEPMMIEDLRAGIKPAARICYLLRHGLHSLRSKGPTEVADLLKEIKKDSWDYFACKCGIWGICYLLGWEKLRNLIFEESDGKTWMTKKEAEDFKHTVMECYKPKKLHDHMASQLKKKPVLVAASGHCRRFYGRETEILGEALSFEPQANTTYATNLAAYKLWMDRENRTERDVDGVKVPFYIEPLHQVHDALIGQFHKDKTGWAIPKIRSYFDNTLIIAGQPIVIPFEGSYGKSWGEQGTKHGGGSI